MTKRDYFFKGMFQPGGNNLLIRAAILQCIFEDKAEVAVVIYGKDVYNPGHTYHGNKLKWGRGDKFTSDNEHIYHLLKFFKSTYKYE